ncbi:MAG TPA: trypsin-like peptidase domain-containing protein [Usitatibacter sp.]|nr:trypsin-like peptidase domain-containing protein [Usitatibacter sp.]
MMRKSLAALAFSLPAALSAWGYAPIAGEPSRTPPAAKSVRAAGLAPGSPTARIELAPLASAKLAVESTSAEGADLIGQAREVPPSAAAALASLRWSPADGMGVVGRISVRSPAAAAMRVALLVRGAPQGSTIRFSGSASPSDSQALPVSATAFWSPVTAGDEQLIELLLPQGADPAAVRVAIEGVSHLHVDPASAAPAVGGAKSSGSCQQDVACATPSPSFLNAKRSVAKIVYTRGGTTYACTGTLLNDADPTTQVPYMITAKHCIDSAATAASVNTYWFLEAPSCGAKSAPDTKQLSGGAQLLHAGTVSDVALLRLNDPAPAGAWFSGLDASPLAMGETAMGLHHPSGDLKKVSTGRVTLADDRLPQVSWLAGSTEGGSSGSGLFTERDGQYLLRATLRGGNASCSNSGRLDDPANRDLYQGLQGDLSAIEELLNAGARPTEDYTDLWISPAQPGTGISVTQQANGNTFVVWFAYDSAGRPTWLTMSAGKWTSATTLSGEVYRSQRPGAQVSTAPVGHASFKFTGATQATLTFTVDGTAGSLPLDRYAF